jgi:N-acetylmuramic acid 6-phosphate etherase
MSYQSVDLGTLVPTEQINPHTTGIDLASTTEMLTLINAEDQQVPLAVKAAIGEIATVVDKVVEAFASGGHLYYVGAGTSGRLGVLDASECPPTFSVDSELVQGIIAGGDTALRNAVEGAEDSAEKGREAVLALGLSAKDVLIGISASGGAAYVVTAVETAKLRGAFTGAITCHPQGALAKAADVAMVAEVGPEILAGSTRMKAGTAQKLILNMITTGAMIAWGKTYRNLMVDLKPTNKKLKERALRLVSMLSSASAKEAQRGLDEAQGQVKPAVVMLTRKISYEDAVVLLKRHHGKLRAVLEEENPS